jgi:twitching motility protein PilI
MDASALTLQSNHTQRLLGEPHLRFQIAPDTTAVLPMQQVQEVLALPVQRLTPLPNLPERILGLMNRRSRVLWVVDLAHLLEIPGFERDRRHYDLVLLRIDTIGFAVAVQQIGGIVWLTADQRQPPPQHVSPQLQPFLSGCVLQESEIWLVLNGAAIAQASVLQGRRLE